MASHAVLGPSGASRWLACTPSARLEQKFPNNTSEAASEGTLAHALGELLIRRWLMLITFKQYEKQLAIIQADKQYEDNMLDYMKDYCSYVIDQYATAQKQTSDAVIFLEQRLDLTDYVPEGFGTGDVVIIADGTMYITDLKYGKGVPVSAIENKQMMLYTLGALKEFDFLYDIQNVTMTIYQPRLNNISTFEMSVSDLMNWAENELKPRAALAFAGEGEYAPGAHCRFCRAAAVCKANADYNLELAKYDFMEAILLEDSEISDILSRADTFVKWLSSVQDHALHEAVNNGKKWPGYKLVEGKSNRAYSDQQKVADKLKEEGYPEEVIYTKSLLGITAMEKAISKKDFNYHLADLIIKPPGKATLVPASDKRPEISGKESAALDFAEEIEA